MNPIIDERDNERWENGELGRDLEHARKVDAAESDAVDEAIGMRPISIRLPISLINMLKSIAEVYGIGYQPMVRDVLSRWANGEVEHLIESMEKAKAESAAAPAVESVLPEKRSACG